MIDRGKSPENCRFERSRLHAGCKFHHDCTCRKLGRHEFVQDPFPWLSVQVGTTCTLVFFTSRGFSPENTFRLKRTPSASRVQMIRVGFRSFMKTHGKSVSVISRLNQRGLFTSITPLTTAGSQPPIPVLPSEARAWTRGARDACSAAAQSQCRCCRSWEERNLEEERDVLRDLSDRVAWVHGQEVAQWRGRVVHIPELQPRT